MCRSRFTVLYIFKALLLCVFIFSNTSLSFVLHVNFNRIRREYLSLFNTQKVTLQVFTSVNTLFKYSNIFYFDILYCDDTLTTDKLVKKYQYQYIIMPVVSQYIAVYHIMAPALNVKHFPTTSDQSGSVWVEESSRHRPGGWNPKVRADERKDEEQRSRLVSE